MEQKLNLFLTKLRKDFNSLKDLEELVAHSGTILMSITSWETMKIIILVEMISTPMKISSEQKVSDELTLKNKLIFNKAKINEI